MYRDIVNHDVMICDIVHCDIVDFDTVNWDIAWMFPLMASTFGLAVSLLSMLRYNSDSSWSYLARKKEIEQAWPLHWLNTSTQQAQINERLVQTGCPKIESFQEKFFQKYVSWTAQPNKYIPLQSGEQLLLTRPHLWIESKVLNLINALSQHVPGTHHWARAQWGKFSNPAASWTWARLQRCGHQHTVHPCATQKRMHQLKTKMPHLPLAPISLERTSELPPLYTAESSKVPLWDPMLSRPVSLFT